MRVLKLIVVGAFASLAVAACGGPPANNSVSNNGNRVANVNATANNSLASVEPNGKQLYTESCQICHRDTGKGGPTTVNGKKIKPEDLTAAHAKKHSDDDLAKDISEGSPDDGMPAFKEKLKPEEIRAIIGYIRTLQQQ